MPSLRFPFLFSQPSTNPVNSSSSTRSSSKAGMTVSVAVAAAAAVAIGMGIAISHENTKQRHPFLQSSLDFLLSHYRPNNGSSPLWGSLSLTDSTESVVESKTGVSFPSILKETQRLLGIGLRKKSLFGLKNIDIYAFGVYADYSDVKNFLNEKYGKLSVSELKENKEFIDDVMSKDISMTIRLQIVYGRLSNRTVRSAFEESVLTRLTKFGGRDEALVQRFTSLFREDIKLPRGSVINISKEHGHVIRMNINGEETGSIQSKLLCQAILDLYIGEDPFDTQAKEDVGLNLASILQK